MDADLQNAPEMPQDVPPMPALSCSPRFPWGTEPKDPSYEWSSCGWMVRGSWWLTSSKGELQLASFNSPGLVIFHQGMDLRLLDKINWTVLLDQDMHDSCLWFTAVITGSWSQAKFVVEGAKRTPNSKMMYTLTYKITRHEVFTTSCWPPCWVFYSIRPANFDFCSPEFFNLLHLEVGKGFVGWHLSFRELDVFQRQWREKHVRTAPQKNLTPTLPPWVVMCRRGVGAQWRQ